VDIRLLVLRLIVRNEREQYKVRHKVSATTCLVGRKRDIL
jgi:hypothetical protein